MGNRILGRSSTIYGLLLLFLRINNIMLFFVCQVWNVTLKKTNEWRGNKEKPVEDLRTLNENYEKSRKATDKKYSYYDSFNMQITILRKLTSRKQMKMTKLPHESMAKHTKMHQMSIINVIFPS